MPGTLRKVIMTCKIAVKNVPPERTEAELRKIFELFGKVISVELPIAHKTKKRLDFCYIEFANSDDAVAAYFTMTGDFLGAEKPIEIRFTDFNMEDAAYRGQLNGSFIGTGKKHF